MSKTAILVDGGYYRRLVKDDWENIHQRNLPMLLWVIAEDILRKEV